LSDISLKLTRIIRAGRNRVFEAWTTSEMITQWWRPGENICTEAFVDLRIGGEIRIANAGVDGRTVWITGKFEKIEHPTLLIYSWLMGTSIQNPTRVTVQFNEHPDGTELVLTHERFASQEMCDQHLKGWTGCLDGLTAFLKSGSSA